MAKGSYPGGDDVIRTLASIANNKHTVGLNVAAHIASTGLPHIHGKAVTSLRILAPRWDPVKNEAELIRWVGDCEVQGDYQFSFQVILGDWHPPFQDLVA